MLHPQMKRKEKSVALQRGLYLLRYESAPEHSQPPTVTVTCEAGRSQAVLHPDQKRAVMTAPGQALVIRATEQGNISIELSGYSDVRTLDATLKFEPLLHDATVARFEGATGIANIGMAGTNMAAPAAAFVDPFPRQASPQLAPLRLMGHVARIGDVAVGADEWLGGPASPSRIEGFQIIWPSKPSNVALRYAVTIAGQRPGESRIADVGDFVGSRGKARPIVGLFLELSGAGARELNLEVETLFLNAPPRRSRGTSLTVTGVTGREPLVGFRVSITSQQPVAAGQGHFGTHSVAPQNNGMLPLPNYTQQQPTLAPYSFAGIPVAPDQPRVRVFRG